MSVNWYGHLGPSTGSDGNGCQLRERPSMPRFRFERKCGLNPAIGSRLQPSVRQTPIDELHADLVILSPTTLAPYSAHAES